MNTKSAADKLAIFVISSKRPKGHKRRKGPKGRTAAQHATECPFGEIMTIAKCATEGVFIPLPSKFITLAFDSLWNMHPKKLQSRIEALIMISPYAKPFCYGLKGLYLIAQAVRPGKCKQVTY